MKRYWKHFVPLLAGAAMIALAGRLSLPVPGTDVPQTAQTLGVLAVGILFGSKRGALSAVSFLLLGALGLPVFAGDATDPARLIGPTGGFLFGFVAAAWLSGWWTEGGRALGLGRVFVGMGLAHSSVLVLGWLRLAATLGAARAWQAGVAPFLVGALAKSLLAALLAIAVSRLGKRTGRPR